MKIILYLWYFNELESTKIISTPSTQRVVE